jgi:hypothetical protein
MRIGTLTCSLFVFSLVAGCDSTRNADPADAEWQARDATQRKLEAVVDVARDLRDASGGVQPPAEADVFAAVRQRYPASTPADDPLLDAWNQPLRYELVNERVDRKLDTGFRVLSAGPNGRHEGGSGDDLQHAAIITETIRGE